MEHFDSKQCRDSFQHPQSCDLLRCCLPVSSTCSLLLDLDFYSVNESDGMFSLFYKKLASGTST